MEELRSWKPIILTVKLQVWEFPEVSTALKESVYCPIGRSVLLADPDIWRRLGFGQLSVTEGGVYVAGVVQAYPVYEQAAASIFTETQVIVGSWLSVTVTV
jgi:hypothetical protein